jgi:glycerol kinase
MATLHSEPKVVEITKTDESQSKFSQHVEDIRTVTGDRELPRGVEPTDKDRQNHSFVGSIDCGTTSSRFIIFDSQGNPTASHQIEFENIYPESGCVVSFLCVSSY